MRNDDREQIEAAKGFAADEQEEVSESELSDLLCDFNPSKLAEVFSNVVSIENHERVKQPAYSVKGKYGSDAGMISYLGKGEWRIFVDNFPSQKKYYATNLPIKTWEQFIADIERTGLKLHLYT